jgi:hypothetical protein
MQGQEPPVDQLQQLIERRKERRVSIDAYANGYNISGRSWIRLSEELLSNHRNATGTTTSTDSPPQDVKNWHAYTRVTNALHRSLFKNIMLVALTPKGTAQLPPRIQHRNLRRKSVAPKVSQQPHLRLYISWLHQRLLCISKSRNKP